MPPKLAAAVVGGCGLHLMSVLVEDMSFELSLPPMTFPCRSLCLGHHTSRLRDLQVLGQELEQEMRSKRASCRRAGMGADMHA